MQATEVDLIELTQLYIKNFSDKKIEEVAFLLSEQFVLEDPVVKRVVGKEKALEVIGGIFENETLSFEAKNIYLQGSTSIIEFTLQLNETKLEGVDIIEWKDGKMLELRAYLDIPK